MKLFELEKIIKEHDAKNGILKNTQGVLKEDLVDLYKHNLKINKKLSKLKNQIKSTGMIEDIYIKTKTRLHYNNAKVANEIAKRFKDNERKEWLIKGLNDYNKSGCYSGFLKKNNFLHQTNCLRNITKNLNDIFEKTQDKKHLERNIYYLKKAINFNEKLRIYDSIFFSDKLIEKYEMLEEIEGICYNDKKYDTMKKNIKMCLTLRKNKNLFSDQKHQNLVFFNLFNVSKISKIISKNNELNIDEKIKWAKLNYISNYFKLKLNKDRKIENYLSTYCSLIRLYTFSEKQMWIKKAIPYFNNISELNEISKYYDKKYLEINGIRKIIV